MFGNPQHALQLLLNMYEVIMKPFGWTIEFNCFLPIYSLKQYTFLTIFSDWRNGRRFYLLWNLSSYLFLSIGADMLSSPERSPL